MVNRYLFLLLLSLGLLWTSNAVAQNVPQGFNYQCIVRDNTGAPINNQTVTLLFTIRNNAPNGPIAYSEMQTVSTNGFGLINLTIGSGTPLQGNFANINWAVGTKFLTVSIETAPGVFDEIGTSQLLSVPYALYALQAANGNDNWGTQTVQTTPVLSGNGTASNPLTLAQQGAQPGQVLKWNGTAWVPQNDETGQSGTVTQVNTGDGLTGGPITTSGTISLANAPVTPGQYGDSGNIPVITVDQYGRVVNATAVPVILTTISAGAGISVTQNGQNFVVTNIGDVNPADDLTTSSTADGEITGPFSNLQIKPGVVTTAKLADGAVTTAKVADGAISSAKIVDGAVNTSKIANGAVVGAKISDMGASVGQVLKWNGATWAPAQDAVGQPVTLGAGMGINVSGSFPNFTITNTGDTDPNDDITASSIADGDITGPFVNLQIKPGAVNALKLANNAVTTLKINTHAVTGEKIDPMGATLGQVLKWNGTTWAPAPDNVGSVTISGGLGIDVVANGQNFLISNTGDVNPFDDVTLSSVAGGDLTGTFNDLQLKAGVVGSIELASNAVQTSKIQNGAVTGEKIAQMAATSGQVLKWNGTTWAPADDVGPDNWGSQTVIVSARLSGNGTGTSPLDIAQMGAAPGQVLKWNGFAWSPANDLGGNNYSAGAGISITGTAPNFTISNTGDNDNDPTNEIQVLSLSGDTLSLSNGGGSVNLPPSNTYTAGVGISITGTAPNFTISNTGDNDNDPTNELQTLSLNGPVLSISGSGSVVYLDTLLNNAGIGLWTASGTNIYNANTGNVGVGTTTPARPLHVKGNQEALRIEGSEAGVGFANGNAASATITKSAGNFALTTLDSSDIVMATGAGKAFYLGGLTGNVGLGNISHPTARLRVSHANGFAGVMIENVGSGGQWDFRVNGLTGALELYNNFSAGISPVGVFQTNGLYVPSDKSLKKDIQSVAYVLERLARLRPVYYRYNGESGNARRSIGFLAQEVEELFPELVAHNPTPDGQVYLGLNYAGFSVLAVKAIQEQQEQLEELRKKNEQLEERLQALEKRLLSLERALSDR